MNSARRTRRFLAHSHADDTTVHAANANFFSLFFLYKIHISPDTGVKHGVWWWGSLSSADQRSRLHSSMDAPKGDCVGKIKFKKKKEEKMERLYSL